MTVWNATGRPTDTVMVQCSGCRPVMTSVWNGICNFSRIVHFVYADLYRSYEKQSNKRSSSLNNSIFLFNLVNKLKFVTSLKV